MARPIKEGLEYFPLDCDIDQDDKIALIEAQHGIVGFGIVIKLLMKIYKNGYFYEWTEKEQLLFSKRVNVDINEVNVIINDLIKWDFFNKEIFEREKILTSKGIQKRYLAAVGRRQKVKILEKHLLLDTDTINAYKNLVIVDRNHSSEGVYVDISTQSKVKKSKVNKTTTISESSGSGDDFNIFKFLESCNFILSPMLIKKIQADIEIYSLEEVKKAAEIADNNGKHTYSYLKGILERRRAGDAKKLSEWEKFEQAKKEFLEDEEE
jgi:DNA replication protein DnaD